MFMKRISFEYSLIRFVFNSDLKSNLYMDKNATIGERLGRHKHYIKKDIESDVM